MKRFLYIVGVIAVSLLLIGGMSVGALMSDRVETAAVQLATEKLSHALGTNAQVGAVEYRFPARLCIRSIYIEDQQHDTLLYVGELYAHFKPLDLRKKEIRFSHVRLTDVVADAHRLPNGTWNYAFLVDPFRSDKPKEHGPLRNTISVRDVRLENLRLRYEDFYAYLSHAELDLHHLSAESMDAQIADLQAQVRKKNRPGSMLDIQSLRAHMVASDSMLCFPTLTASLPHSRLDMSGVRIGADSTVALTFHEAELMPADIAIFLPRMKNFKRTLALSGNLSGSVDSLAFNEMEVRYNGRILLQGNLSAKGLTEKNNLFLQANLTDFHTQAAQLQDFLSQLYGRPMRLPVHVHRLGDIHYRGLAEGHLHNLTLHGAFRTALGTITTDGTFRSDSLFKHMNYDARVVGRRFRLGRLARHAKLGTATLDFRSSGQIDNGSVSGTIKAHVRDLTYNNYTYEDLHINGSYRPHRYEGRFKISDPHLDLAFDGVVNMQDIDPEFNFNLRCNHFDSAPLGIEKIGSDLRTSFALAVDMNGTKPDDISGYLVLDSLFLATSRDSMLMQQLTILASADRQTEKSISLRTDYLTAQLDGSFRYADIVPAGKALLHHYLPTAIEKPKEKWQAVSFMLRADGERLRDVQRLFVAPVTLSDHPTLRAEADIRPNRKPYVSFRFFAPGIRAGKTPLHDLTVTLNTIDTLRHSGVKGSGLALSISTEAKKMQTVLSTLAFRDTLLTHLTLRQQALLDEQLPEGWRDLSPRELQRALSEDLTPRERQQMLLAAQRAGTYGGDIRLITHFSKYNKKPLIDLHFLPGTLLLRDSVYTLSESRITYCAADTSVQVDHFAFDGGGQHIYAHGLASRRAQDTLAVDLQRLDAAYIVPFLLPVQTIMFNGLLTGKANITSVLRRPHIETQIHIDSMGLNNTYFGDAEVQLHIDDSLGFHADVYNPSRTVVALDGMAALFDGSGRWKLDMTTDSVPLAFINHWTASVLQDVDGTASGHVVVGGHKGFTYVLVRAQAQDAHLTLPWTGARYTIPADTIIMDTTAIIFPDVHLIDAENNLVEFKGSIHHTIFQHFALDLHVDAHNALVFDKIRRGEMLQGHVYANGHVDVTGPQDDIVIFADARTSRNSRFRLSLDNVSSAYESNFIHFVEHTDSLDEQTGKARIETDLDNIDIQDNNHIDSTLFRRNGKCVLKLNLEVNPQLLFQLVLGERNGDMIQAHGNGALSLTYDTETSDVSLLGTYDIDYGTLSYTVANVIRKEFTVGEGSTISFSGDAANPQLNVTAKHRVMANLRDLFGDETDQLSTTRTTIPVLTCLHMTGPLSNPILSFSLEFPLSDQAIQEQVRQVINTEEMLMRQVIYLLVFGRFFTPDYMANAQMTTLNSTYSLLSSTVTSQINAWLSKLTNIFTLGVAIRTNGEGSDRSQEYEAQFQLQPVDRLVINGNLGYRYNDLLATQPFFGDLDVELKLTNDGQLRLKGYTHMVDKYSLRQASTIQGFGLLWKKDFNWPSKKKKTTGQ